MEYYLFIFIFTLSTVYPLSWETGSFRIQVRRTGFAMKVLFSERSLSLVPAPSLWVPPLPFWRKGPTGEPDNKDQTHGALCVHCLPRNQRRKREEGGQGGWDTPPDPSEHGVWRRPWGRLYCLPFLTVWNYSGSVRIFIIIQKGKPIFVLGFSSLSENLLHCLLK